MRLLRRIDSWLYWHLGPMPWHPPIQIIDAAPAGRWWHLRDDPRFAETIAVLDAKAERTGEPWR